MQDIKVNIPKDKEDGEDDDESFQLSVNGAAEPSGPVQAPEGRKLMINQTSSINMIPPEAEV